MKELHLSSVHKSLGADMKDYEGWEMPVKYDRITSEHMSVRENVGLFDISHMGEIKVRGEDASDLLQLVTSNDVSNLEVGSMHYSTILNEEGGVKDDLIVYRNDNQEYMLVPNAGNTEKIYNWLCEHEEGEVEIDNITSTTVMFSLQGPKAQEVLQSITRFSLSEIDSFEAREINLAGVEAQVSRSGYTKEDGFEIHIFNQARKNSEDAVKIWSQILENGEKGGISPCGLGARDSLRLESGLPLYGHELTEDITPLEAQIGYAVEFDKQKFIGRKSLLRQKEEGISEKRVGVKMKEKGIPRKGNGLFQEEKRIGEITSGGFSPLLERGIGMGYAPPALEVKEEVKIEIRGERKRAVVEDWPFHKGVEND